MPECGTEKIEPFSGDDEGVRALAFALKVMEPKLATSLGVPASLLDVNERRLLASKPRAARRNFPFHREEEGGPSGAAW